MRGGEQGGQVELAVAYSRAYSYKLITKHTPQPIQPQELEHLKAQIGEEVPKAKGALVPAAFVTFNDRYTQTLASTGMHSHDELAWRVQARAVAHAFVARTFVAPASPALFGRAPTCGRRRARRPLALCPL